MKNSELAKGIIEKLEKEHLNLYHDVSKAEIQNYIQSAQNIDTLSPVEFDCFMLKLFALFKDAHTSYFVPFKPTDHKIVFLNEKFYVFKDNDLILIDKFGKLSADKFFEQLKLLINFETQGWLNHEVSNYANNGYVYEMLGLSQNRYVDLTLSGGEKIRLNQTQEQTKTKNTRSYDYKITEDNVLCLRYRRCVDDADRPFDAFVRHIRKTIEEKNVKQYVLDLRGNSGGNSEILNPFQQLAKEKQLKGCVLIDNGVFSSGRFAVARFKKDLGATLIGQPTGGAAKSYGYPKRLEFGGKEFSASTRLWDFSYVFGYEGAILPDIQVEVTADNVRRREDVILDKAFEFLKRQKTSDVQQEY